MKQNSAIPSLSYTIFVSAVVSLGGFLFGFDAAIISGVIGSVETLFELNDVQTGWVVSSPSFAAMFAMLAAGALSNKIGRKKVLLIVAFLYASSALFSAGANSYEMLYLARMVGGLAFGAALVLAPMYIAEIANAENRGKLVSIQQLNIVIGFSAAYFCGYYLNELSQSETGMIQSENAWRWMLGMELFPAILYFFLLFFIPKSPRWLILNNQTAAASVILKKLHGDAQAELEIKHIQANLNQQDHHHASFKSLFQPALRFVLFVGLAVGILQQVTGINAVFFYVNSIFEQTGIGTNAAFAQSVVVGIINIVFTLLVMTLIDRMGRRPLLLIGIAGVAISLLITAYGFQQATYELSIEKIETLENLDTQALKKMANIQYDDDLSFKNALKATIGISAFKQNETVLIQAAANINSYLILFGILGFVASFAFSLGPVMWVMLSELFPNKIRALAIGFIGFINSFSSWVVQQIFPWELSNLGTATTFFIYAMLAVIGFFLFFKILPETKGKTLEELEAELVK